MGKINSRKISRHYILAAAGLLIVIFAGIGIFWWLRANSLVATDDARVKGTIITISPKISGRIKQVLVKEGETVQPGQTIIELERDEFEVQVLQAKASLTAAMAKLSAAKAGSRPQEIAHAGAIVTQARANLANAERQYERSLELYDQGAMSAQQKDAEHTAFVVAKAQHDSALQTYGLTAEGSRAEDIEFATAQVEQAQAALKNAELLLANTIIASPATGTIAMKAAEPGEIVSAGQPLLMITNLNDVWISANIEETYIGKIKVGLPVEFTIDAYPGRKFAGEVSEVGSATSSQFALLPAENTSGNFTKITQRLPVKIRAIDADNNVLKPGMSALISIRIQ